MITIGDKSTFAFRILPLSGSPSEPDPAASATWAALQIWVRNRNLTAHTHTDLGRFDEGLHWPVIHLVRWLVHNWSDFYYKQQTPIGGSWRNARDISNSLDSRLLALEDTDDEGSIDRFLEVRDSYVLSHALPAAAGGGLFPDVYLLRDGARLSLSWSNGDVGPDVWFHLERGEADVGSDEFLECVTRLVDWTCQQLERQPEGTVDADIAAIKDWRGSLDQPAIAAKSLWGYAGIRDFDVTPYLSSEGIDEFFGLPSDWSEKGSRFDPSKSSAAILFRAITPLLSPKDSVAILQLLRQFPREPVADEILWKVRTGLPSRFGNLTDYEDGYSLAIAVREQIGNPTGYLDIEGLLKDWGMKVETVSLRHRDVDGGAVWDADHGPVIVVNAQSPRSGVKWGRRMVLAHELCHLLVDRHEAGRLEIMSTPFTPPVLERRANAFAAELLLPRAGIVSQIGVPSSRVYDVDIETLMTAFEIGETTCSRHVQNRFFLPE